VRNLLTTSVIRRVKLADSKSMDFDNHAEMSMTTKGSIGRGTSNMHGATAWRGLAQPLSNANRLGQGSVTTRVNTTIGVYWGGAARAIETIYLLAAFGVLGGIPPLLNGAIKCARYVIASMQGSQADTRHAAGTRRATLLSFFPRSLGPRRAPRCGLRARLG
jgi:hypothetical protein